MQKEERYIWIDEEKVMVSEEVYHTYWHYQHKEEYFMRDLKTQCRTVKGEKYPPRECSYDYLLQQRIRFVREYRMMDNVEDMVISSICMESLLNELKPTDRYIIYQLFWEQHTEVDVAEELGITQGALNRRKKRIFKRLRKLITMNEQI